MVAKVHSSESPGPRYVCIGVELLSVYLHGAVARVLVWSCYIVLLWSCCMCIGVELLHVCWCGAVACVVVWSCYMCVGVELLPVCYMCVVVELL